MGGRLVLLKTFSNSILVYLISFFKTLTCMIYKIESMFKYFLGMRRARKYVHCVLWDKVCLDRDKRGLR